MSRLETWRYGLCPGGVMEIVDMFGWYALTICQYYLSLQQGSASKFKPEVHVAAVMHQTCPFFGGDGGMGGGGGIGMGGLSKVCSLLNPQVFQIFRIPSLACCLFQTQLQPTTHPFLQHGRLFHMQITSQGLCLALSGGPLNGTCGTPDISGLMHVTEVSACLFQWW